MTSLLLRRHLPSPLLPLIAAATLAVVISASTARAQITAVALEFQQQPTDDAQAGATISPAVTVRAVDLLGVVDLTFEEDVTITIDDNPGGGILSGTTTVAADNGVATFGNLSINRNGSDYTLAASASGLTGDTSDPFDVTIGPASGATTTIAAVPTSLPADGTSVSEITVEVFDAQGNPRTEGGDVVVLSQSAGTLSANPAEDNGDGTYTAFLTASSTAETATVSGTVNDEAITETAAVTFTAVGPGPPSGATSEITANPTSIDADGADTSTITVQLRDASGTALTSGGDGSFSRRAPER